jgi:hypothetical protein
VTGQMNEHDRAWPQIFGLIDSISHLRSQLTADRPTTINFYLRDWTIFNEGS